MFQTDRFNLTILVNIAFVLRLRSCYTSNVVFDLNHVPLQIRIRVMFVIPSIVYSIQLVLHSSMFIYNLFTEINQMCVCFCYIITSDYNIDICANSLCGVWYRFRLLSDTGVCLLLFRFNVTEIVCCVSENIIDLFILILFRPTSCK